MLIFAKQLIFSIEGASAAGVAQRAQKVCDKTTFCTIRFPIEFEWNLRCCINSLGALKVIESLPSACSILPSYGLAYLLWELAGHEMLQNWVLLPQDTIILVNKLEIRA